MAAPSGLRRVQVENDGEAATAALDDARKAWAGLRWLDAYERLSQIDRQSALPAEDLELLAGSAFMIGRADECRHVLLRAYQIYVNRGELRLAARCALKIGLQHLDSGDVAEAAGCLPASMSSCSAWVGQGSALLEHEKECAEHGYLLIPVAYEQLVMKEDPAAAASTAGRAVDMGRRFDEPDLLALALTIQGRAVVRSGPGHEGLALLDEAVTVVATGEVSSTVAGIVLTSAIDAGDEAFDLGRYETWAHALARWCEQQEGMVAFRCRALVHRATLSQLHGRWDEALDLARQACQAPIADADPSAAAAARYRMGEVLRLRGERAAAESAYGEAARGGLDPQPGLALIRLAEGAIDDAIASVGRALAESGDRRAGLLAAQVEILLASGEVPAAATSAEELADIAGHHESPILFAMSEQARSAVLLAEGDPVGALTSSRKAAHVWRRFDLPYEEGRARVLTARSCRALGDGATAGLELDTARQIFVGLGAEPDLDVTEAIMDRVPGASTHGLTRRELEVLGLLATGMTNRAIAEELVVAVRTVDTHVSNIFTKLGVSTRAAATSFAYRHGLVEQ